MAEFYRLESDRCQNQFVLTEHNCAIAKVAKFFPVVCAHELEMFAALLPDCTIERPHWINNGDRCCGYLIRAK
ncbi:hypothetical protein NIES593_14260 [Hydrococcus rivularis NIES-593]|uniref:Iron-sulfur cluster biosynthesis transcriptional regulator SufR n=1 Tax=Hydrococcus rivularis NIES-593 TaxID=1921803 RepID=A0A1U7HE67_9CYAN|nr:hypothetical protein [Hydrococcus rivularis]OKH21835.1 hypothetical protein NIES593_14260 [Hydrococcus rivularis NIES-593]